MNTVLALSGVVILELCRRKDFYVVFVLTTLITLVFSAMNFFGDSSIFRYVKEICLLLIWLSMLVIAITTAARQIPAERESRTLFPLLAKPVSRSQVVLGKFLGCWLACGAALLVFYGFFIVLSATREHHFALAGLLQTVWLHWLFLAVVVAMSLLGSLVFAAPSSNSTICFVVVGGIWLLARHLNKVALQLAEPMNSILYFIYFAVPHLDIFDVRDVLVHGWPAPPLGMCALATLYAAIYTAFFLVAACWMFRRKALN
jgi:ABC-type transport system involved in multi-copper enzyme maturation permease subunit